MNKYNDCQHGNELLCICCLCTGDRCYADIHGTMCIVNHKWAVPCCLAWFACMVTSQVISATLTSTVYMHAQLAGELCHADMCGALRMVSIRLDMYVVCMCSVT